MKLLIATVLLAAFVAVQGNSRGIQIPKHSAVTTLKDYNAAHRESKIFSGQLATRGQLPHQAAILMHMSNGDVQICGGSLISTEWVLTAAHCVAGVSYWEIRLGVVRLDIVEPGQADFLTNSSIIHPNYIPQILNNDIALIRLPINVELNNYIQLMRLPRRADAENTLSNLDVTISGWGRTSDAPGISTNLYYTNITTITNQACTDFYNEYIILNSTLCAKGHPANSPCKGDSGGPLIHVDSDGQLTQVGVFSFIPAAGCTLGGPAGFVRTASFLDWISVNTGIAVRP